MRCRYVTWLSLCVSVSAAWPFGLIPGYDTWWCNMTLQPVSAARFVPPPDQVSERPTTEAPDRWVLVITVPDHPTTTPPNTLVRLRVRAMNQNLSRSDHRPQVVGGKLSVTIWSTHGASDQIAPVDQWWVLNFEDCVLDATTTHLYRWMMCIPSIIPPAHMVAAASSASGDGLVWSEKRPLLWVSHITSSSAAPDPVACQHLQNH